MMLLPPFPLETHNRLVVQTKADDRVSWGKIRPATMDDFIAVFHEMPKDDREKLASVIGLVSETVAEKLKEAEKVIDFLERGRLPEALDALVEYRKEYPEEEMPF